MHDAKVLRDAADAANDAERHSDEAQMVGESAEWLRIAEWLRRYAIALVEAQATEDD